MTLRTLEGTPVCDDLSLGDVIKRARRLVHDRYARATDDGAGDQQPLELATRQCGAAICHVGMQAHGQRPDDGVKLRNAERLHHLFWSATAASPAPSKWS